MAIDLSRVIQAALEAATQGPSSDGEATKPKPHLSSGRALLLGAGLLTVGRLAAPKGREMLDTLQQRLEELESDPEEEELTDEEDYDEEPQGEGDEDFDDQEDEEPEGEGDEDFDDEEDEEPEGEAEEDFDDEEDEEPEGEAEEDFDDEEEDECHRPRR
jgi:hypothetical protein